VTKELAVFRFENQYGKEVLGAGDPVVLKCKKKTSAFFPLSRAFASYFSPCVRHLHTQRVRDRRLQRGVPLPKNTGA